jgi:DNA polymerase-3 subunit delta
MVALKASDAARILKSPKSGCAGYLFFGTDAGQVTEYCRLLAASLASRSSPTSEILRLSEHDLHQNPGRLAIELRTTPMFGGAPVIWVRSAQHLAPADIEEAFGHGTPAAFLIVEAGNLAKTSKLRQIFEQRPDLAAVPCYGDDAANIPALINALAAEAGIQVGAEASQMLRAMFGNNLGLARSELAKLMLFAHGETEITPEIVTAAIGDVAESEADGVIAAILAGNTGEALQQFGRLVASNVAPQAFLILLNYNLLRLVRLRAALDTGEPFATAARKLRPPLHFKMESTAQAQCRAWSTSALSEALALVQETVMAARLNPAMEQALTERTLAVLCSKPKAARAGQPR